MELNCWVLLPDVYICLLADLERPYHIVLFGMFSMEDKYKFKLIKGFQLDEYKKKVTKKCTIYCRNAKLFLLILDYMITWFLNLKIVP